MPLSDLRCPADRLGSVVGWDRGGWRLGLGRRVLGSRAPAHHPSVAGWWWVGVLPGEVSAFRWQEQHDSALIEAALTNGGRDGTWHADRWGVVFEVLFDTNTVGTVRGLPVVRAALDAVPDPVNGLPSTVVAAAGRYQGAAQAEARAELGCRFAARARGRAVSESGGCLRTGRPADDGRGVTAAAGYMPSRAWPR